MQGKKRYNETKEKKCLKMKMKTKQFGKAQKIIHKK